MGAAVEVGGRCCRRGSLAEAALYLGLALAATWPLARAAHRSLPLGTETAATVPLLNVWTVWWNADRARRGFRDYWDAPIFYPTPDAFAFSEPLGPTVVLAPLVWLTGSPIVAYNAAIWLTLTLNGWSTFRLLRCLRLAWLPAVLGGALVEVLPFVHNELGILQLVPVFGSVWTMHALYRFGRRPTVRAGLLVGAAFALTFLMCVYYGLFLCVLLPLGAWWLLVGWDSGRVSSFNRQPEASARDAKLFGASRARLRLAVKRVGLLQWRTWLAILPGLALGGLLIAPEVLVQRRVIRTHRLTRPADWFLRLSAHPADYLRAPWPYPVEPAAWQRQRAAGDFDLCPGLLKLLLAGVGAVAGFARRRWRAWTACCVTVLIAAFFLSLGPGGDLFGCQPYRLLMQWVPGFAQARNVFRFAVFVHLMVALLAAVGLQGVSGFRVQGSGWGRLRPRWRFGLGRTQRTESQTLNPEPRTLNPEPRTPILVLMLGVLAVAELWPPPQRTFSVPPIQANRRWIDWLTEHTAENCVIACVPFPSGTSVQAYEDTAVWMYWQTFHQRRMVNGYSGFFPAAFLQLKDAMLTFPDEASLQMLAARGVDYCVVRQGLRAFRPAGKQHLIPVFSDRRAGIDIYRLQSQSQS